MQWTACICLAVLPAIISALASTDTVQDGDPAQSGYLPNHNMDPSVLTSGKFAISWSNTYNTHEVFYAKPLVYTPPGSTDEFVITASNQNIIRVIDGITGREVQTRTLDPPFQSADIACGNIPNTVGITGTPIVDPTTETLYFFAKGYRNGATGSGILNGRYKFYAVQVPSLQDVPGFPATIDGHNANNDPTRYFLGGTVLQRPSLASIGNIVLGAFGGHCDKFNYTGFLVAVSKTTGVGVTNVQAMEAAPGAPSPQALDINVEGGGKAGIWQSGMGLAVDGNRVFFATGNGRGPGQNGGAGGSPASGKKYLSTLEQAVADYSVDPSTGVVTQSDYFQTFEYDNLNGGDRDIGGSGVALLDPAVFYGPNVTRIAITGSKAGKIYIMNADDLGGFKNGPGGTDKIIQSILTTGSIFGGVGSYPLEGGYIYFNPAGDRLYAYKMGYNPSGNVLFTLAGKSAATFAGESAPAITSLNGQPGSGIVWLADVNNGLAAFNAVPINGVLTPLPLPATGPLTKNRRPVFGNGRVYVSAQNTVMAVGRPPASAASAPLSSPLFSSFVWWE